MYESRKKKQPSVLGLLINVVVFVFIAVFSMISLGTGDPLWFWPVFDAQPEAVTVFCYGEGIVVQPGSEHFATLTALFNENISGYKNWDSLTMSVQTWEDYQTRNDTMTLVLSYPEIVRIHSTYKYFSGVDTLIVPLDGRHSKTNAVFGLTAEVPSAGALHIENTNNLSEYLNSNNICQPAVTASN